MRSMDSTDVTNRKPRRCKGTPTYKFRNYTALSFVAYTLISGALLMYSPLSFKVRHDLEVLGEARKQELEDTTEDERMYNRIMMSAYRSILHRKQSDSELEGNTEGGSQ